MTTGRGVLSVELGSLEVFGAIFARGSRIRIRPGKRFPVYSPESRSSARVSGRLRVAIVKGDPIPRTWRSLPDLFLTLATPRVVVLGPTDSGKSALTTYLANVSLNVSSRVGIVDGDPGQGDIGPPTCISGAMTTSATIDLRELAPTVMEFVGVTSPSLCPELCVRAVSSVANYFLSAGSDFLFLNTDGWVHEGGLEHKRRVLEAVGPDLVITLGLSGDLSWLAPADAKLVVAEVPGGVLVRGQSTRYRIRLANLLRHLRKHKVLTLDPRMIRNPAKPERGTVLALMKEGKVKSLGVLDAIDAAGRVQAYCGTDEFDEVVMGSASVPEVLDRLREGGRYGVKR